MKNAKVLIRNLTKTYEPAPLWSRFLVRTSSKEPIHALTDISFDVNSGEICVIVGPNGAGKSTLFRILTGLITPTSGYATIEGFDVTQESFHTRSTIGFMPADDRSLWLRLTCAENLAFHGRLQSIPEKQLEKRIREYLALVDLEHATHRVGFALSAGMRARLQLARALIHRPTVLILDEPTGTIDPVGAYQLLQLLQKIVKEEEIAVLISSHRLEEIESLDDNVALLDKGRLVHWGDLASLRRIWTVPRIDASFDSATAAEAALATLALSTDCSAQQSAPDTLTVTTKVSVGALLHLLHDHQSHITSIQESQMSLRELINQKLQAAEIERQETHL